MELTIKIELGGTVANMETRLDERLHSIEDKLDRLLVDQKM